MLFDPEAYARYLDLLGSHQISLPIIPGTKLLKNKEQARRMESMFQVKVSEAFLKSLPETKEDEDPARALDLFLSFVEKLRSYGAPGIHLFVLFVRHLVARSAPL